MTHPSEQVVVMHTYIHICIYIYVYVWVHICMFVYTSVHIYIYVAAVIDVVQGTWNDLSHLSLGTSIYIHVHISSAPVFSIGAFTYMYVQVSMYIYMPYMNRNVSMVAVAALRNQSLEAPWAAKDVLASNS